MATTIKKRRNSETGKKLEELAGDVVKLARKKEDPWLDIPTRSLSNAKFDEKKQIITMGSAQQRRYFFNLGQAKKFMQTMLVAAGCKALNDQGKTTSIRDLYYHMKHTIEGTRENTFDEQSESDPIIEDLEVAIEALREELGLFAENKGAMVGNITLVDNGDTIDGRKMGTGGWSVPSIVEPNIIQFKKCEAEFILLIEKGAVWRRFNEDRYWDRHNCIIMHGGGQPPRGVRRLMYRMHHELKLPVYVLVDNDPWGYYIYSVVKQGSINLAFESERMAIPKARFHWHEQLRRRPLQDQSHRDDRDERRRHPASQGNHGVSMVQEKEGMAEGNRAHAEHRREAGTRSAEQQGFQLYHGRRTCRRR